MDDRKIILGAAMIISAVTGISISKILEFISREMDR